MASDGDRALPKAPWIRYRHSVTRATPSPMASTIQSPANPLIKRLTRLMDSPRTRREEGVAILEGWHLIESCLHAPAYGAESLKFVVLSEKLVGTHIEASLVQATSGTQAPCHRASASVMARVTSGGGDNACVAAIGTGRTGRCSPRDPEPSRLELWLDAIQDPGNVGTLIRTATAAGAHRVVLGKGCADAWSPKSLRAGMGGHFHVTIDESVDLLEAMRRTDLNRIALDAAGEQTLFDMDLTGTIALILGAEGAGLDARLAAMADHRVRIPMLGPVESLNVAAAGATACFERVRQSRTAIATGKRPVTGARQ